MTELKTLKDIELQICRRKETKDGLSDECFCEEDLKKEICSVAREWIKELEKDYAKKESRYYSMITKEQVEKHPGDLNYMKNCESAFTLCMCVRDKLNWIRHFFNLSEIKYD